METETELLGEEESLYEEPTISFAHGIIKVEHSFGYDCKKLFNLVLVGNDTLIFASGNFLNYFSISRLEIVFQETIFGCGIGFIAKNEHPDFDNLFTVAENGPTPTIYIYEYPSLDVRVKLRNAAKSCFTAGAYNKTGELFASQAGYPDFTITIWRWEKPEVVLRAKSFQSDILFVHFSEHNPILLCSSGVSHIKFWKMANTFTGLKLKGDLGRFGKTDFSDIYAMYMLSDENVISGCDWGNMLLWQAGLIKFEICRKGRKPCHTKPITRITMKNGEVTTVGMDGYVRVWYWETVDLADPPEDDLFVEIDPIYEFKIADVELRCMQKIEPFNEMDFTHYAQDGKGGIWFCDINTYDVPQKPQKLFSCIGGKVVTSQMSPVSPHFLCMSECGKIFVYNYEQQRLLLEKQFPVEGVDMLWLDTNVSVKGTEILAGFTDGVVRQLYLDLSVAERPTMKRVRVFKAHTSPVTRLTVNRDGTLFLSGSADMSIFIYLLGRDENELVDMHPLGFVQFKAVPNCFYWHEELPTVVLVGCKTGEVYEYDIRTKVTKDETYLSYNITEPNRLRSTKFVSVKSVIRREIKRQNTKKRKEQKRERKMDEIEKLKKANPGLQIDVESALADSEPDEEEEALHIPAVPNPILWLRYTTRQTIWVSMAGYDAGYIYELEFGPPEPTYCTMIADADDIEIHSYCIVDEFMIFGLFNGSLRINALNSEDFTNLSEYRVYPMHDSLKGIIPSLQTSYNGEHMLSVGFDGNMFLFQWNGPKILKNSRRDNLPPLPEGTVPVPDISDPDTPSLEQEKINAELRRQQEAAEAHDRDVLNKIGLLQNDYFKIIQFNEDLPPALRANDTDLLLDSRITQQIRDELQAELDDVREDLAYDLEFAQVGHSKLYKHFLKELVHVPFTVNPLRDKVPGVSTIRLQALGEEYEQIKRDIEERLQLEHDMGLHDLVVSDVVDETIGEPPPETFFFGRDPHGIEPRFSKKMMRLLTRYRNRQMYEVRRLFDWDKLERQKPDPNRNHPDDDAQIELAKRNLGDFKLKMGTDYEPKSDESLTQKYIEVVESRQRYFDIVDAFNTSVESMRERKRELVEFIAAKRKRLEVIHSYIPELDRQPLDHIEEIDMDLEYPELNLVEQCTPGCGVEIDEILTMEMRLEDLIAMEHVGKPSRHSSLYSLQGMDVPELQESAAFTMFEISKLERSLPNDKLIEELLTYPPVSEMAYYEEDAEENSAYMQELRHRWLSQLLVEQAEIRAEVDEEVRQFDNDLQKLQVRRFHVKLDAEFMSSFLISLNQELYILRDSEEIETQLLQNAKVAMNTRNELQAVINLTNRQLDELRRTIDKMGEQIGALQVLFLSTVKGHKFFDFLRRIFKKKWRPPKVARTDDEESSSSESSSSSEDEQAETKSMDSMDMTTIRLDETTCPSGLDRALYELAFAMRSDRHELERNVRDLQRDVDNKRREIGEMQIKMKYHEEVYQREKNALMEFRRNRQQEVNKVNLSVILRMDQLQHFYEGDDYRDISKAVLFDANMLVDLRRRADQLSEETLATRRWHRINFIHLRRMNTDIKFMRFEITRLEEEIRQAMMKKFGIIVNLDELEEEVLRRYIFDLETDAQEELNALEKEFLEKQKELSRCEEELVMETQNNTEKVNIMTVLREEKNILSTLLEVQERNYAKWSNPNVLNLSYDIEKLRGIETTLLQQIECLEREICALRLKSKPLQINELETDSSAPPQVTSELLPNDDELVCPAILNVDAYMLPPMPDEFIMDRVHTIVQKSFNRLFGSSTTPENVRKFAQRSSIYLCQAAYNFQGRYTDRIAECITEHLQTIVPKKYFIHISADELRKLFNEVVAVFDYERSDINTEDLISGIFDHAKDSLCAHVHLGDAEVVNRTHFIVAHMFKELIEVLPLEEFQSDETLRMIVDVLEREPMVDPRAIGVEKLIESTLQHAHNNLLDGITAVPVRKLGNSIQRDLIKRRQYKQPSCESPMSVRIATKKTNVSGLPF